MRVASDLGIEVDSTTCEWNSSCQNQSPNSIFRFFKQAEDVELGGCSTKGQIGTEAATKLELNKRGKQVVRTASELRRIMSSEDVFRDASEDTDYDTEGMGECGKENEPSSSVLFYSVRSPSKSFNGGGEHVSLSVIAPNLRSLPRSASLTSLEKQELEAQSRRALGRHNDAGLAVNLNRAPAKSLDTKSIHISGNKRMSFNTVETVCATSEIYFKSPKRFSRIQDCSHSKLESSWKPSSFMMHSEDSGTGTKNASEARQVPESTAAHPCAELSSLAHLGASVPRKRSLLGWLGRLSRDTTSTSLSTGSIVSDPQKVQQGGVRSPLYQLGKMKRPQPMK